MLLYTYSAVLFLLSLLARCQCYLEHCCSYSLYAAGSKEHRVPKTHYTYVSILLITVQQDKRSLGSLWLYTDTHHNSRLIVMIFIIHADIDTAPWDHASPVTWSAVTFRVRETKDCLLPWLIRPRGEHCVPTRHAWSAVPLPTWAIRSTKPHFRVWVHNLCCYQ